MAGVPNTLPLQDLNRDAELGRVGCSLCPGQTTATSQSPWHKTKFYNMLDTAGQTNRGPVKGTPAWLRCAPIDNRRWIFGAVVAKSIVFQQQSGLRMQSTAQAVGRKWKTNQPQRGESVVRTQILLDAEATKTHPAQRRGASRFVPSWNPGNDRKAGPPVRQVRSIARLPSTFA